MNPHPLPSFYPNQGGCKSCLSSPYSRCDYHAWNEKQREQAASENLAKAVWGMRHTDTMRLMSRLEIESDEKGNAYDKARVLLSF